MKPTIYCIADPFCFVMIAPPAPGALWPTVIRMSASAFVSTGGGWKAHHARVRRGEICFVTDCRYDPHATGNIGIGRDCLGRSVIVLSLDVVAGLALTQGTNDLELDLRKLFTRPEDAKAATADLAAVLA